MFGTQQKLKYMADIPWLMWGALDYIKSNQAFALASLTQLAGNHPVHWKVVSSIPGSGINPEQGACSMRQPTDVSLSPSPKKNPFKNIYQEAFLLYFNFSWKRKLEHRIHKAGLREFTIMITVKELLKQFHPEYELDIHSYQRYGQTYITQTL